MDRGSRALLHNTCPWSKAEKERLYIPVYTKRTRVDTALLLFTRDAARRSALPRGRAGGPAAPSRAAAGSSRCAGRSPRLRAARTRTRRRRRAARRPGQSEHVCSMSTRRAASGGRVGVCAACMHGVRLRLARRTAISMAPPQQSAARIRAAYRAGGRRLSHFTHARSGSPQMVASG